MPATLNRRQWLAAALATPWAAGATTEADADGLTVLTPQPLVFPRDHGTHPHTRTEWWYLTGCVQDAGQRPFGFQVTFFRSRVDVAQRLSGRLAARHLLFAHAAITDVQGRQLHHEQRIARWNGEPPAVREGGVWADAQDLQVVLRDWSLRRLPEDRYATRVRGEAIGIDLLATARQPLLLQGLAGFSRKGPDPAQASFYTSHPQLAVQGHLRLAGQRFAVQGRAWLDHEWSQSLLHPEAVGWDWIGMNLDDGSSLTAFQLRRADGSALWTGGSWRTAGPSAAARPFQPGELRFGPERHWSSPRTRARYPVVWQVDTPVGRFTVQAVIDAQELDSRSSTGTVYWEGLCDLLDAQGRRVGCGYLEMTGYAQRLQL
jgi:predicted secreted hydrolase